ncbi:hypothetical protein GGI12_005683, partial [Dipsacomyces acuminosporus]
MQNALSHNGLYPFVQVLSMSLLGISLVIVAATVAIRWLAKLIDKFGISHARLPVDDAMALAVARYDSHGVFLGPDRNAEEDQANFELANDGYLPLYPDWRRDFSVEILDLAGTCLKQYSSQVKSCGYSRSCDPMRLPKTTVLDEYIEKYLDAQGTPAYLANGDSRAGRKQVGSKRQKGKGKQKERSGFGVYIEDEPNLLEAVPANPMDLVMIIRDTR